MIAVVGGTGLLGRNVVGRLVGRGVPVRVVMRNAGRGRDALGPLADRVELVEADVREPGSLHHAVVGADTVVAAVQGFGGHEAGGIAAVDREGNRNLVRAAASERVARFLLLSIHDASSSDALALGRAKAVVEADLRATAMEPLVIRPTAYMETWAGIVGDPILASGRARVFGRGANPINFVSAGDVATVVEETLLDADGGDAAVPHGRTVEVIGPEDLAFDEVVARFEAALGRPVPVSHVPLPVLRMMARLLRPLKPVLADQVAAAVVLDTTDRRAVGTGSTVGSTAGAGQSTIVRAGTTTFDSVIEQFVAAHATGAERGHTPGRELT